MSSVATLIKLASRSFSRATSGSAASGSPLTWMGSPYSSGGSWGPQQPIQVVPHPLKKNIEQRRKRKPRRARFWWGVAGVIGGFSYAGFAAGAVGAAAAASAFPTVAGVSLGVGIGVAGSVAISGYPQGFQRAFAIGAALQAFRPTRPRQMVTVEGGATGYTSWATRNWRRIGRAIYNIFTVGPPLPFPQMPMLEELYGPGNIVTETPEIY